MAATRVTFIKHRLNRLQLRSESKQILDYIRKTFTVANPNWRHMPFGEKYLSPISPTFTFQAGLSLDIIRELKNFDKKIEIDISECRDVITPMSHKTEVDNLIRPQNESFEYRDYQADAIVKGLRSGRGLFEMATSAGKSLIIYGLIRNIWHHQNSQKRVLLLVPNCQLVEQMYKDFLDYGCPEIDVARFSSTYKSCADCPIIISNRDWLHGHSQDLPGDIEIMVVDEVHQLGIGSKVSKFVSTFKTECKFGFTGTLPEFPMSKWHIQGLIGPLLKVVKPHELQVTGHIADTKIIAIRFEHEAKQPQPPAEITDGLERAKMLFPLEWRYIENCQYASDFICQLMMSLEGNKILLYDHTTHGKKMKEILDRINLDGKHQVFMIDGSTPMDYREMVRHQMEIDNNCFLLGQTKCVSTGISIKNVHNIGFAFAAGTSSAKILQSIGRGLRLRGKFSKNHVKILDFYHNYKYSINHFGVRLKMYKENYDLEKITYKTVPIKAPLGKIHSL